MLESTEIFNFSKKIPEYKQHLLPDIENLDFFTLNGLEVV